MRPQTSQNQAASRKRHKAHEPIDWASYDRALVERGSITIWFAEDAVQAWHPEHGGKRGGQYDYSDLAIEASLNLRLVFKQALRQTEGFVQSLIGMMNLDIKAPDHTTLCRRSKTVRVGPIKRASGEPVTVVVDSSGLKVYGQGEWDAARHGRKKRRRWRKLHLCIDEGNLEILSHGLTTEEVGDSTAVPGLLDGVGRPVDEFLGDGAYDGQPVYDRIEDHGGGGAGQVTVPPRSNATPSLMADSDPTQRDGHVRFIDRHGRQAWEVHVGYGRRLVVENAMYRYKTIIGGHMRARDYRAQKTEAAIGCKIVNRMLQLGLPQARLTG
jgi:hypothetical protein